MNGAIDSAPRRAALDLLPEVAQGFDNLRAHKLRSILTMMGMIFGVAAVIAMLSIGAGAQQQVIAFIEQLGVRNIIVEAREAGDNQTLQRVRLLSAGLSFSDLRAIEATVDGVTALSARKRFVPAKTLPRPQGDIPAVFGVSAVFEEIGGLSLSRGRFFTAEEDQAAAAVTVLGQSAAVAFFGGANPVGEYVKFNDQWFRVNGDAPPRKAMQGDVGGNTANETNKITDEPQQAANRSI
jgi:putative ABC transport system permease protein